MEGGLLDHNPRKIHAEDSLIIILQDKSKCLLLNDKQMPHERQFSLLDEIQNRKKMDKQESKERKFEKKNKRTRVGCFNIYIVIFAFLSSIVKEGRW